jgi:hypothetical protein
MSGGSKPIQAVVELPEMGHGKECANGPAITAFISAGEIWFNG